jgi:anti-repressor protein
MSGLTEFRSNDFPELNIFIDENNREYFRAIDVCSNLRHSNPTQALNRHVDKEYIYQFNDGTNRSGLTNYLSEPGVYQLIFSSKTEWAKKFQKWVFEDVLPKLRANGNYFVSNTVSFINQETYNFTPESIYLLN